MNIMLNCINDKEIAVLDCNFHSLFVLIFTFYTLYYEQYYYVYVRLLVTPFTYAIKNIHRN